MKRKSDDPLEKVTLNLVKGDYSELQLLFPRKGAASVVRTLVHNFIKGHKARIKARTVETEDLELSETQILEDHGGEQ